MRGENEVPGTQLDVTFPNRVRARAVLTHTEEGLRLKIECSRCGVVHISTTSTPKEDSDAALEWAQEHKCKRKKRK